MKVFIVKKTTLFISSMVLLVGVLACLFVINYTMSDYVTTGTKEQKLLPIYSVENNENKVSLTFDCAWGITGVDELTTLLDEQGVKATFFVTGEWCDKYPDVIKDLSTRGHSIQNHSDKHPHIKGIDKQKLIADTASCDKKIESITGIKPKFYRAPYGEYDLEMLNIFKDVLKHKVTQWDIDSRDWKQKTSNQMIESVIKNTQSGSILLFHTDIPETVTALKTIIPKLKESNFKMVVIEELINTDNYTIDNNGRMKPNLPVTSE